MTDSTVIVLSVLAVGGAVYLATRKEAAADDGPEADGATGMCGRVGAAGDQAGGYGMLAGPICGIAEKVWGVLGIDDSQPIKFMACLKKRGVAPTGNRAIDAAVVKECEGAGYFRDKCEKSLYMKRRPNVDKVKLAMQCGAECKMNPADARRMGAALYGTTSGSVTDHRR